MKEIIFNEAEGNSKGSNLFFKLNSRIKGLIESITDDNDDKKYRKYFDDIIGPKIYRIHLSEYFICCAFCSHLVKSSCHEYCFKCSKGAYLDCSFLLPGIFPFYGSYFYSSNDRQPWIFRTPCSGFERLSDKNYYRHFNSINQSITVANYEVLEGIFTGVSRGKKPCHLCASVNMDIYSRCSDSSRTAENENCNRIIEEISSIYKARSGMIRYIE